MRVLRTIALALALAPSAGFFQSAGASEGPAMTAEAIMERVASNQDRAEAERSHYVYVQHARVVSRKGKTVRCEEVTDSRMTPSATGYEAQLLKLDGRVWKKDKYLSYTTLPAKKEEGKGDGDDVSLKIQIEDGIADRDMVENMRAELINDKSKDGLDAHLFPLTSKNLGDYVFRLVGRERMNDHEVFHIGFRPKNKADFGWKGDAYVDTTSYQPVLVTTSMARKIPFAVRTLLGTNLPGLGFSVVYAAQPDGVWFPVSFGTEFKLRVLFFFSRAISIDAHNVDFEKTHVTSRILDAEAPPPPQ